MSSGRGTSWWTKVVPGGVPSIETQGSTWEHVGAWDCRRAGRECFIKMEVLGRGWLHSTVHVLSATVYRMAESFMLRIFYHNQKR